MSFQESLKKIPKITWIFLVGSGIFLAISLSSGSKKREERQTGEEKLKIDAPKTFVDPRDVWVDELNEAVEKSKNSFRQEVDALQAQLKEQEELAFQLREQMESLKPIRSTETVRQSVSPPSFGEKKPSQKSLLHLSLDRKEQQEKSPSEKNRAPSLSHAKAVLLTGAAVSTAVSSQSSPEPVLLRIVSEGAFSDGYTTEQINKAEILASCYGDLSKERAVCRLEQISMKNSRGDLVETKVEGWIFGEDGRQGMKGVVVDKASDVARMAILNGILGGMASFFQNQAQSSVYPISPIFGPQNALKGEKSLEAGAASGMGNALQKLADYAIKRAEQPSPVVLIESGRSVDIVFGKGISLFEKKQEHTTPFSPSDTSKYQSEEDSSSFCPTCFDGQEEKALYREAMDDASEINAMYQNSLKNWGQKRDNEGV